MEALKGKNILLIIPKSQFCEEELAGLLVPLKNAGANVIVLSKNGQKARGMGRTSFQPDGILVDWDKQPGVLGKYSAVFVLGGKGSAKSLWDDPILPQILTDHHRAGKIVGAIGTSVVSLVKAGLVYDSSPSPDDEKTRETLESIGVIPLDTPLYCSNRILIGKDSTVIKNFFEKTVEVLDS